MKTTRTLALIGALGMLAGAALAQPAPGDNDDQRPPQDRPGANRPGPEMRRKMLTEKYDANKDGKLDDSELATLGKDVVEGRFGPPPGQGRRGPDGQAGPGLGGGPRAQGPGGFDADRPPMARGQDGAGFDGPRAPRPPGDGQQGLGQRGEREGGFGQHPDPRVDREGAPERGQLSPGLRGPGGPPGEDARKALATHRREFLKKYDADGDGKLSPSEREAIGRDIEEGKLPPPPLAPQPPREPQPPRPPE